jgi:hypothetical protein
MVLMLLALPMAAQIRSGTITGNITDTSGSSVPDASVIVLNQGTNSSLEVKSGVTGEYNVPYLPAGKYSVTVRKDGFQPYRKTDISISSAQTVRVDAMLTAGRVETAIEVRADAVQLQTENSTVQSGVDSTVIENIPNIQQNPLIYATLQAGVTPRAQMLDTTSPDSFGIGFGSRMRFSAFNINGGAAFTNDIQLDGLSVQGSAWNEAAVLPNPDALQEVKVIANNYSAEYGRGQGVVSMVTKSGTNELHGGVNYMLRNEALNANSFGNNAQGVPRGPFKVNQFGGHVGGPILKDRLFYFASYERLHHSDPANWMLTIPTMTERAGDFSKTMIRDNNGNPISAQLFDPYNVVNLGPNLYQRMPVPNSKVSNPSSYALKHYNGFPEPNRAATDPFGSNNFFTQKTRQFRKNNLNARVDYRLGMHSIYGTGGFTEGSIKTPRPFGDDSPFFQPPSNAWSSELTEDRNPYGAIGDTVVLSPTLVLDVRYGVNRIHNNSLSGFNETFDYDAYGVPANVQQAMPYPGSALEIMFPERYSNLNMAAYQNKRERQTNHTLAASATKSLSRWTLKAGTEYRVYLSNYTDFESGAAMVGGWNGSGGNFTSEFVDANGNGTSLNVTPQQNGFGGASNMMGAAAYVIRPGFPVRPAFAQKMFSLYTQNDWRATRKLTVNLGLRWELQPGPTDRYDRMSSIDFGAANPYSGPGKYVFAGTEGYSRNLWDSEWKNFQPRVGAAYRLTDTTVLRGGFGRTYIPTNTGYYNGPFSYGAGNFAPYVEPRLFGTTPNGTPVGRFWDAAASRLVPAQGAVQAPNMYGPYAYMFDRTNMRNGYTDQWNFFIERQISPDWFASAGYVGTRGRNLQNGRMAIQNTQNIPDSTLSQWTQQFVSSNGQLNPAYEQVANPYQPNPAQLIPFGDYLGNSTIERWRTMLPYPMLGNMSVIASNGYSNYNALQMMVRRAYSNGLQFQASYTWSKATEFTFTELQGSQGFSNTSNGGTGAYDLRNFDNNKSLSATDIPQRFVALGTYELPFGSGRAVDLKNPVLKHVLGNWNIGAVYVAESGLPFGAGGFGGSMNGRGDRASGVDAEVPKELQRWYDGKTTVTLPGGRQITPCNFCFLKYNPDLFQGRVVGLPNGQAVQDPFWFGTAARTYGDLRGFGRNNIDLSLTRRFAITERFRLDVQANFTNALNHTQFASGNFDTGTGTVTVTDPATGLKPGMNSNSNFGTHGLSTYEPRQVTFTMRLRF